MMTAQDQHGNGECSGFNLPNHRIQHPAPPYLDRNFPYAFHEDRTSKSAIAHEQTIRSGNGEQNRRRIQVACARCRRRKIKCSGDPGGDIGCTACRTAGVDPSNCTFHRVGSHTVETLEMIPSVGGSAGTNNAMCMPTTSTTYGPGGHSLQHRHSLPTLHGRSTAAVEHDSTNISSDFTHVAAPPILSRQQSVSDVSGHTIDVGFRPWLSRPNTTAIASGVEYYDSNLHFGVGQVHSSNAIFPGMPVGRLNSVTSDTISSLNLSALDSSLPTQVTQERRLPVPYTQLNQYGMCGNLENPHGLPTPPHPRTRMHANVSHGHSTTPWPLDTRMPAPNHQIDSLSLDHSLAATSLLNPHESTMLAYPYPLPVDSSEVSPVAGDARFPGSIPLRSSRSSTSSSRITPSELGYRGGPGEGGGGGGGRGGGGGGGGSTSMASDTALTFSPHACSMPVHPVPDFAQQREPRRQTKKHGGEKAIPRTHPPLRASRATHAEGGGESLRRRSSYDDSHGTTAQRLSKSALTGPFH